MSEHFHDAGDLRFLKEMGKLAPAEFNAWLNLDQIVAREDGAIPRKFRELIALAVACTTQCPYCIEVHTKGAKGNACHDCADLMVEILGRQESRLLTGEFYETAEEHAKRTVDAKNRLK